MTGGDRCVRNGGLSIRTQGHAACAGRLNINRAAGVLSAVAFLLTRAPSTERKPSRSWVSRPGLRRSTLAPHPPAVEDGPGGALHARRCFFGPAPAGCYWVPLPLLGVAPLEAAILVQDVRPQCARS